MNIISRLFSIAAPISDDKIRSDFKTSVSGSPTRCARCSRLYPRGEQFAWAPSSSHFSWFKDDYETLRVTSRQVNEWMAFCFSCIRESAEYPAKDK